MFAAACGGDDDDSTPDAADAAAAGPDAPAGSCASLDLLGCRARRDCAADICPNLDCSVVFEGCRDAADTPVGCPPIATDCCHTAEECNAALCVPPAGSPGCGICMTPEVVCTYDSDCNPERTGEICQPLACACNGESTCVPGCNDDEDCGEAEHCDTESHHCAPIPCSEQAPCPPSFTCGDGLCGRTACDSDLACGASFCVNGYCYGELGTCLLPPP
jgi:hypothetical protein